MKTLIAFLLLIINFNGFSQDSCSMSLLYTKVIEFDSTYSKDALFNSVEMWFSKNFKESKAVIDVKDKESGLISGKGFFYHNTKVAYECYSGEIKFSISIFIKEGRIKYELNNFSHESSKSVKCEFKNLTFCNEYIGEKTNWGTTKSADQKQWTSIREEIEFIVEFVESSLITEIKSQKKSISDW